MVPCKTTQDANTRAFHDDNHVSFDIFSNIEFTGGNLYWGHFGVYCATKTPDFPPIWSWLEELVRVQKGGLMSIIWRVGSTVLVQ